MTSFRTAPLVAAILMACCFAAGSAVRAGEDDEQEVRAAVAGFHTALNNLFTGDAGPMAEVWSHADDVTYMGPTGGYEAGWDAIREKWEQQAALKLGGAVEPQDVRVNVGSDVAVAHNVAVGENTNVNGEAVPVRIRVTSIFRRENGQWKMIGHHTDVIPSLVD